MTSSARSALLAIGALALSLTASAGTLNWTLQDMTFSTGGSISGSFSIDTTTAQLSSVDITTTADGSFAGDTYLDPSPGFGPYTNQILVVPSISGDLTGEDAFYLAFDSSLLVAGTDDLIFSAEGTCTDSTCSNLYADREGETGYATSSSTPEPATGPLVGALAIAALILVKYRPGIS
jgi:hypothetical protein